MKVTHTPAGSLITRHGERYVYTSYGCRCEPCKDANTEYITRRREERIARAQIPESVGHGKAATANNWGCKCQLCLDAKAEDNHSQYEARKKGLAEGKYPGLKHGVTAYTSYGCRCKACRDAVNAQNAEKREAEEIPDTVAHGKRSTYTHWSCRCPLCKAAEAAYYQKRKEQA